MIRQIRRTPQSRQVIISIYNYLYSRSPGAAERVLAAVERTIRNLARFPNVGNRWISAHPKLRGMRFTTVSRYRNYLVFFKPVRRTIEVHRIVHAARDLPNVVNEIGD